MLYAKVQVKESSESLDHVLYLELHVTSKYYMNVEKLIFSKAYFVPCRFFLTCR